MTAGDLCELRRGLEGVSGFGSAKPGKTFVARGFVPNGSVAVRESYERFLIPRDRSSGIVHLRRPHLASAPATDRTGLRHLLKEDLQTLRAARAFRLLIGRRGVVVRPDRNGEQLRPIDERASVGSRSVRHTRREPGPADAKWSSVGLRRSSRRQEMKITRLALAGALIVATSATTKAGLHDDP